MIDKQSASSHSRRTIIMAAILAVVLALTGAYILLSLPPHKGSRVSIVSGPIEFSLQLEKKLFIRGENISISISLKNISNQTVTISWHGYGATDAGALRDGYVVSSVFPAGTPKILVLDLLISDENGTVIAELINRVQPSVVSLTLAAGETVTQTFIWYTSVDPIPRGLYYLKATTSRMYVNEWPSFKQLETSSITIEILEGNENGTDRRFGNQ